MLLLGQGIAVNGSEALTWFMRAMAQGSPDGAYSVGVVLSRGFGGVSTDYVNARRALELAYNMNYKDAANELGRLYENGLGVSADRARALQYYREAASAAFNGGVRAQARLALVRLGQTPP
jgi:uncharacterized protein